MLRDRTDRAWFGRIVQHLARKWSVSILTTWSPHGALKQSEYGMVY